jgi:hypothetical protein
MVEYLNITTILFSSSLYTANIAALPHLRSQSGNPSENQRQIPDMGVSDPS